MKKISKVVLVFLLLQVAVYGQQAETASAFLERVSDRYASFKDYSAGIAIRWIDSTGKVTVYEAGRLLYKAPNSIKITYSTPENQILVINDDIMQLYLPQYNAVQEQKLAAVNREAEGILTGNGLSLMRDNYTVSYVGGPSLQPIASGSKLMVYKLKLEWKVFSEGFRTLVVSIDRNLNIIQIEAVTSLFETVRFDYSGIRLNQNIPNSEFVLEVPETDKSIVYPNFLFPIDR